MRIALLEDDHDQAALIVGWLEAAGHQCQHFDDSQNFLRTAARESFDLFVLDWMVPKLSGLEVLERLHNGTRERTPVVFVTARDREDDIVRALQAGADDYMTKPVRRAELLARVSAVGRRAHGFEPEAAPEAPPYEFDLGRKTIRVDGEVCELTHREFELAVFMFRNVGRVMSRAHILETIWGMHGGGAVNTRTVDTHISRLRKKLGIAPERGWKLSAVYQHGYRLERLDEDALGADAG